METKTAEDIYLDLLRIDSHAKQIKEIMPGSGLSIAIDFDNHNTLYLFLSEKGIVCEKYDHGFCAQFENIQVNIY